MRPSPEPPTGTAPLLRFSPAVRWVHRTFAVLVLVCIATAAVLYDGSLAVLVGHRYAVRQVHVLAGFALPLPLLAGLAARSYRADLRRLDRFTAHDWHWLRSGARRGGGIPVGKFNAGQKLNAALSCGGVGVLLLSGAVMAFPRATGLAQRVGATFVHDWAALALVLLVAGHLTFAARDPVARRGMRTGYVDLRWSRREHGMWAQEQTGEARRPARSEPEPQPGPG